jgi:hypothetical protein
MTCYWIVNKSNMTGVTSEAGTAQPSGESEITFIFIGGRHGRDHMVVGFTTDCAMSAYYH